MRPCDQNRNRGRHERSARRFWSSLGLVASVLLVGCTPRAEPRPAARAGIASSVDAPLVRDLETPEPVRSEPWSFGGYEGELVTTTTHLLHLTLTEGRLRDALPEFTGMILDHYRTMITEPAGADPLPAPGERMSTFVFESRPEWAAWTRWRLGNSAGTYLAIERGGYTIDAESVLWDIGRYDTLCMVAHEGWHQYTQTVFRHPLPAFLEEGLAAYAEGHSFRRTEDGPRFLPWHNFERYGQLRSAVNRDRLIDLDRLVTQPPQQFVGEGERSLLTYYAQVWALVHYLMEGEGGRYRDGLAKFLSDAAHGHIASTLYDAGRSAGRRGRLLGPDAGRALIAVYFDPDYPQFKRGYEAFIRKIVASGNGTRIWRGESPVE